MEGLTFLWKEWQQFIFIHWPSPWTIDLKILSYIPFPTLIHPLKFLQSSQLHKKWKCPNSTKGKNYIKLSLLTGWSMSQACQCWGSICTMPLTRFNSVSPKLIRQLDWMILVGPFQLSVFYISVYSSMCSFSYQKGRWSQSASFLQCLDSAWTLEGNIKWNRWKLTEPTIRSTFLQTTMDFEVQICNGSDNVFPSTLRIWRCED